MFGWKIVVIAAILLILVIVIGVPAAVIAYKRQKGIDEKTLEIIRILNRMEIDEVRYKILEKEEE